MTVADYPPHRCQRCGIDVWQPGAVCRDCLLVDAALIRSWRT